MLRVVKTESGYVRGAVGTDARITVFKGIPYAADTSGENRWRAPQPAVPWDGIRDCYEFAPITMQQTPGINPDAFYSKEWHVDPAIPMSEDSLVVNIWSPAKSETDNLPVMAWIFGGGLHEGYAHEMEFDGERMASRGVILVTIAYRLNAFGYLAHPDLTAEDPEHPTNFGFLDQAAGLAWIQRNIAAFGGNPDNVTLFGQSAGGVSVFTHMCSPKTEGLFHKAIIESSAGGSILTVYPKPFFRPALSLAQAEAQGIQFLKVLGVDTIEEARKLDAKYIRDKVVETGARFPQVIDGRFSVEDIKECLLQGRMHNIPFMIGYTEDEMPVGVPNGSDEEAQEWINENYGPFAAEYAAGCAKYAAGKGLSFANASLTNMNETSTRLAAQVATAQGHTVYCYAFDPEIPGDDAGSFHSSDLWFQFETLMKCWRPFTGKHYDLARQMCNYWTNFAKSSNPNGLDADGTPMPEWKAYTAQNPCVMHLYDHVEMEKPEDVTDKYRTAVKANLDAYSKGL